jgi:Tfp pilus assembly protein PilX
VNPSGLPGARSEPKAGEAAGFALRDERGMALLIAVILLLMISAIGLTALQSAQDEASGAGRSRRKTMTLYAADAGLKLVEDRLNVTTSQYPNTAVLEQSSFMTDQWGSSTAIRTGNSENPVAQPVLRLGRARSSGFALNVNAANSIAYGIYRTGLVATDTGGGVVELQAQYSVSEGAGSYR